MIFPPRGFRIVSEETVHQWAMFRLVRRLIAAADGTEFERSYVHTPGAVATVAITVEGELVLVEQYRASCGGYVLEIPAGMRDVEDEDPIVTAQRELREEAGCDSGQIVYLGQCLSSPGVTNSSVLVYLATELRHVPNEPHGPEEEAMTIRLVPFSDALKMVEDGHIHDAKSAYGILLAARRRPDLIG